MPVAKSGLPAWLIMFSLACIGVFVAGLVVYLQRGDGAASATPQGGSGSAGSAIVTPIVTPDAAAAPVAPAGMMIVKKADGSPWFYVDANPVTAAQFKTVFADHKQSGKPDDAVVMLKYDEARSYARTKGGRLLRAAEWDAASTTPGFIVTDGLFEWVEPGADKVNVKKHGKGDARPDGAQKDVTFRMAKDI